MKPTKRPAPRVCSIARSLDVVGEKWSLLALREVFLGVRRCDQIDARTGAPRDVLTARLRTLVEAGVLEPVQYSERPPRSEYHLTQAGRDLQPGRDERENPPDRETSARRTPRGRRCTPSSCPRFSSAAKLDSVSS